MAFISKRKFDDAEELFQDTHVSTKHTKVAPMAEPVVTEDVDMGSDDAPSPAPSLASLATTASSHNSPSYPHFDLYPFPTSGDADMMDSNPAFDYMKQRSDSTVGLMQPQTIAGDFVHHGTNCSQIPRLRLASHPGLEGRRSLWSHCIECGAVEMVSTS
ncbi:unnamed protein product [Rhizoctonia solani]|uniref:Uncharacterized protein n=3 Tax=Rhizoctonia solani TaxID=456999 RepID=A0A8H3CYE0_9AGAM|nr:hypothetical protein RSOL_077660 [Rhizoctonia solani AG-3 Rhs1AP]KEP46805.1 hypothetical protein V565_180820 [Rhizoctonia solani 123E]CAE6499001.1 unnamed protein product [Rhizoctonia solani]